MLAIFSSYSFAEELVDGGIWSYGDYHDPFDWGAFSNYHHETRWHWSKVVRGSDSEYDRGTSRAGGTSKAFINTKLGEHAYFYYGF